MFSLSITFYIRIFQLLPLGKNNVKDSRIFDMREIIASLPKSGDQSKQK
jgi:hypothetical protein